MTAQFPDDIRKIPRSQEEDGTWNFSQLDISEISFKGRFGLLGLSFSDNTVSIGIKTFLLIETREFRVGDDIQITSVGDPRIYMWGEIIGTSTTAEGGTELSVFVDDLSPVGDGHTANYWELQVVARPKPGIEKDTSTTSVNPTTGGPWTFTVTAGKFFPIGGTLLIKPTADRTIAIIGEIDSYSGTSLVVSKNASNATVSTSYTSWSLALLDAPPSAAARSLFATSTTSQAIPALGDTVTMTVGTGKECIPGSVWKFAYTGDPTDNFNLLVLSYTSGDVTGVCVVTNGSGTYASWSAALLSEFTSDPYTTGFCTDSITIPTTSDPITLNTQTGKGFSNYSLGYIRSYDGSKIIYGQFGQYNSGTGGHTIYPISAVGSGSGSEWIIVQTTPSLVPQLVAAAATYSPGIQGGFNNLLYYENHEKIARLILKPGTVTGTSAKSLTFNLSGADRLITLDSDITVEADPGADRIFFWDDSTGRHSYLIPNTGLAISGKDLNCTLTEFTDEAAQDAVGNILTDSSRIDFTYSDATPSITADIVAGSVSNTYLADMATSTIKGRVTAGTGDPEDLTAAQARTVLGLATTDSPQFTAIELGHASDTTLTRSSAGDVAVEGNVLYRAGGTDVALADGGTGASLTDPNADRIMFWDDSAGAVTWLEAGSGLTISGTTLTASAGWTSTTTNTTSGSTADFTIPSTANEVLVSFNGVSTDTGSRSLRLQALTAAATPDTTAGNYVGFLISNSSTPAVASNTTASFIATEGTSGNTQTFTGTVRIHGIKEFAGKAVPFDSNWRSSGTNSDRGTLTGYWNNGTQMYGIRALISGSGSFDAGSITVSYR